MMLKSMPALKVCRPCVLDKVSENCMRCSSGNAARGSAFGSPYVITFAILTLGAEPLALMISRSRDHWKRKLFTVVGVMVEFKFTTKIRSRVTAFPFALNDSLFCVGKVR